MHRCASLHGVAISGLHRGGTCEYMEREARFCKEDCMRVDVFGLYLDLSQRMNSQPKVPTDIPGVPYEYQLFPKEFVIIPTKFHTHFPAAPLHSQHIPKPSVGFANQFQTNSV